MMSACGVTPTAIHLGFAEATYDDPWDSDSEDEGEKRSKPIVPHRCEPGVEQLAKDTIDHESTARLYTYVNRLAIDGIQGVPASILSRTLTRPPKASSSKKRARTESSVSVDTETVGEAEAEVETDTEETASKRSKHSKQASAST